MATTPKGKGTAGASGDPSSSFLTAMAELQQAGMGRMTAMSAAWMDGIGTMNSELAQFIAARMQEDMRTQTEMMTAKSPTELQAIQLAFLQRAVEQYTAQTGKVVELTSDMLASAFKAE